MSITHYEFDNANPSGDKEPVIPPNTPTQINKLSANETNNFRDKLNEVIDNVNILDPSSDNFVLKDPSPETSQTIEGDITIKGNIYNEYIKEISVGSGGDYTTLEDLFDNEPAGKTLINLIDAAYSCVNPAFVVKEGWIIKGQGIGKTKITFTFTTTIDPDTSGLHIRQTCKLEDFEVITVNNVAPAGLGQYALHADYSTYSNFKATIYRCSFRTVLSAQSADANNFNGLAVGIGSWEGQILEFHGCILEGAYVTYSDKYTLNLHNTYITGTHTTPSRISYYNTLITGGFTAVLISDVYSNDSEPNEDRIQDSFDFVGCDISSLWLRSFSQLGTVDKKNGLIFNFTGTKVREFLNTAEVVDTSLSNYTIKSLPVTEDVEYLKNVGASTINAGDFVCYVYDDRLPEYHLSPSDTINTVIGVEKLGATNINNFAGISQVTSLAGDFLHFQKGAIAYTSFTSTTLNIGDNVAFDDSGNLIKANFGGIGTIRKKTFDNRLGIELTPSGTKTNIIGSNTHRGIQVIRGNSTTVGSPDLRFNDASTNYNYRATLGTNSNTGLPEDGRFALDDLTLGFERFGISKVGLGMLTGREFRVSNHPSDASSYSMLSAGNSVKTGYIKLYSAFSSGNGGFGFWQDGSGTVHFEIDNLTEVKSLFANGNYRIGTSGIDSGEKLQVEGEVKASGLNLTGLSTYADDAAAGAGGLTSGDVYKTATGELRIKL